jgi:hypothetical protein
MAKISNSFSTGNSKRRTTTTSLGMDMTPPRKRRTTMSRLRRTRWQGASYALGHPMKTMTKMTAGTSTTELTVMTAPPAMTVPEMMAATGAVAMATSAQVLRPSVVGS